MKRSLLILSTVCALGASSTLNADQNLATSSGCIACHNATVKTVGPSINELAGKYQGQGAVDALVAKVKTGGSGVWGPVPMPPNAHVPEDNIRKVVEWMLNQ